MIGFEINKKFDRNDRHGPLIPLKNRIIASDKKDSA